MSKRVSQSSKRRNGFVGRRKTSEALTHFDKAFMKREDLRTAKLAKMQEVGAYIRVKGTFHSPKYRLLNHVWAAEGLVRFCSRYGIPKKCRPAVQKVIDRLTALMNE